jgi:hypothetical protein
MGSQLLLLQLDDESEQLEDESEIQTDDESDESDIFLRSGLLFARDLACDFDLDFVSGFVFECDFVFAFAFAFAFACVLLIFFLLIRLVFILLSESDDVYPISEFLSISYSVFIWC